MMLKLKICGKYTVPEVHTHIFYETANLYKITRENYSHGGHVNVKLIISK